MGLEEDAYRSKTRDEHETWTNDWNRRNDAARPTGSAEDIATANNVFIAAKAASLKNPKSNIDTLCGGADSCKKRMALKFEKELHDCTFYGSMLLGHDDTSFSDYDRTVSAQGNAMNNPKILARMTDQAVAADAQARAHGPYDETTGTSAQREAARAQNSWWEKFKKFSTATGVLIGGAFMADWLLNSLDATEATNTYCQWTQKGQATQDMACTFSTDDSCAGSINTAQTECSCNGGPKDPCEGAGCPTLLKCCNFDTSSHPCSAGDYQWHTCGLSCALSHWGSDLAGAAKGGFKFLDFLLSHIGIIIAVFVIICIGGVGLSVYRTVTWKKQS